MVVSDSLSDSRSSVLLKSCVQKLVSDSTVNFKNIATNSTGPISESTVSSSSSNNKSNSFNLNSESLSAVKESESSRNRSSMSGSSRVLNKFVNLSLRLGLCTPDLWGMPGVRGLKLTSGAIVESPESPRAGDGEGLFKKEAGAGSPASTRGPSPPLEEIASLASSLAPSRLPSPSLESPPGVLRPEFPDTGVLHLRLRPVPLDVSRSRPVSPWPESLDLADGAVGEGAPAAPCVGEKFEILAADESDPESKVVVAAACEQFSEADGGKAVEAPSCEQSTITADDQERVVADCPTVSEAAYGDEAFTPKPEAPEEANPGKFGVGEGKVSDAEAGGGKAVVAASCEKSSEADGGDAGVTAGGGEAVTSLRAAPCVDEEFPPAEKSHPESKVVDIAPSRDQFSEAGDGEAPPSSVAVYSLKTATVGVDGDSQIQCDHELDETAQRLFDVSISEEREMMSQDHSTNLFASLSFHRKRALKQGILVKIPIKSDVPGEGVQEHPFLLVENPKIQSEVPIPLGSQPIENIVESIREEAKSDSPKSSSRLAIGLALVPMREDGKGLSPWNCKISCEPDAQIKTVGLPIVAGPSDLEGGVTRSPLVKCHLLKVTFSEGPKVLTPISLWVPCVPHPKCGEEVVELGEIFAVEGLKEHTPGGPESVMADVKRYKKEGLTFLPMVIQNAESPEGMILAVVNLESITGDERVDVPIESAKEYDGLSLLNHFLTRCNEAVLNGDLCRSPLEVKIRFLRVIEAGVPGQFGFKFGFTEATLYLAKCKNLKEILWLIHPYKKKLELEHGNVKFLQYYSKNKNTIISHTVPGSMEGQSYAFTFQLNEESDTVTVTMRQGGCIIHEGLRAFPCGAEVARLKSGENGQYKVNFDSRSGTRDCEATKTYSLVSRGCSDPSIYLRRSLHISADQQADPELRRRTADIETFRIRERYLLRKALLQGLRGESDAGSSSSVSRKSLLTDKILKLGSMESESSKTTSDYDSYICPRMFHARPQRHTESAETKLTPIDMYNNEAFNFQCHLEKLTRKRIQIQAEQKQIDTIQLDACWAGHFALVHVPKVLGVDGDGSEAAIKSRIETPPKKYYPSTKASLEHFLDPQFRSCYDVGDSMSYCLRVEMVREVGESEVVSYKYKQTKLIPASEYQPEVEFSKDESSGTLEIARVDFRLPQSMGGWGYGPSDEICGIIVPAAEVSLFRSDFRETAGLPSAGLVLQHVSVGSCGMRFDEMGGVEDDGREGTPMPMGFSCAHSCEIQHLFRNLNHSSLQPKYDLRYVNCQAMALHYYLPFLIWNWAEIEGVRFPKDLQVSIKTAATLGRVAQIGAVFTGINALIGARNFALTLGSKASEAAAEAAAAVDGWGLKEKIGVFRTSSAPAASSGASG